MKRNSNWPYVGFIVIVVGLFIATLLSGNTPKLGLDLQGGVSVVLQPVLDGGADDETVTRDALDQTKTIIEKRVNAIGVGEPDVTVQGKTIVVQIPGIEDQQAALDLVGKTAELRFRPVLQNLAPAPTSADEERIEELRAELEIPDGVSALQVVNDELAARGQPTIPDPATTTTTAPTTTAPGSAPTTVAPPTTAPTTTAAGDGTGGSRSAKVARLRQQDPTTTAAPTTAAPTTTVPPTTTTIDPTPKNQYGIEVYSNAQGEYDERLTELLQLEQAQQQSELETTPTDEDVADATVILNGLEEEVDGRTVTPRYELGPTLLTGKAIEDATAGLGGEGGTQWVVKPVFKEGADGIDLFNEAAALCNSGAAECPTQQLAIVLDGEVLSAPTINEATFARDSIEISGSFDETTAKDLATALRFGSLPVTLEPQQVQTVSATLGEGALDAGLIAGAIGVALVLAYMVLYYRILGLVTMGALALSAMVLWTLIATLGATQDLTLTLAGIVGIVVSVGVSLDSSIVFYESLKEDVRNGRTIRSSVESSFSSAYGTIIKADMSSLIGAAVLYVMSIGPVRGFAFYLGISTILDLVMAYMFTRPTVRLLARSKLSNRPGLFGIPTDDLVDPSATVPVPVAASTSPEADVR